MGACVSGAAGEKDEPRGYWGDIGPPPGGAGRAGVGANAGESGSMPAHVLAAAKAAEERVKQRILANQAQRSGGKRKAPPRSPRSPAAQTPRAPKG